MKMKGNRKQGDTDEGEEMKVNLTKLLFYCYDVDGRVIKINDYSKGTTGDTSYIPPNIGTTGYSPYSFELEETAEPNR